jgi:hypothetical protein
MTVRKTSEIRSVKEGGDNKVCPFRKQWRVLHFAGHCTCRDVDVGGMPQFCERLFVVFIRIREAL